jgi:hypothetical protein
MPSFAIAFTTSRATQFRQPTRRFNSIPVTWTNPDPARLVGAKLTRADAHASGAVDSTVADWVAPIPES